MNRRTTADAHQRRSNLAATLADAVFAAQVAFNTRSGLAIYAEEMTLAADIGDAGVQAGPANRSRSGRAILRAPETARLDFRRGVSPPARLPQTQIGPFPTPQRPLVRTMPSGFRAQDRRAAEWCPDLSGTEKRLPWPR